MEGRIPEGVSKQLTLEHGGRVRLRWSPRRQLVQVEAKQGRGRMLDRPLSPLDDEAIREQDGFTRIGEVALGDRIPCPWEDAKGRKCGQLIKVPVRRWVQVKCPRCGYKVVAPFFPLTADGDLLQHLRYVDPDRGGLERVFQEVDEAEEQRERRMRRERHETLRTLMLDEKRKLLEISGVGYTGRERMWRQA